MRTGGAHAIRASSTWVQLARSCREQSLLTMSIRQYFKTTNQLPDPKEPLSNNISSSAIALANREVLEAAAIAKKSKKCGSYHRCSSDLVVGQAEPPKAATRVSGQDSGGLGACPPENLENLDAWRCHLRATSVLLH